MISLCIKRETLQCRSRDLTVPLWLTTTRGKTPDGTFIVTCCNIFSKATIWLASFPASHPQPRLVFISYPFNYRLALALTWIMVTSACFNFLYLLKNLPQKRWSGANVLSADFHEGLLCLQWKSDSCFFFCFFFFHLSSLAPKDDSQVGGALIVNKWGPYEVLSDFIWWSDDRGPLRGYIPESLEEERVGGWREGRYVKPYSPTVPPPLSAKLGRSFFGYDLQQFQEKALAILLKQVCQGYIRKSGNTALVCLLVVLWNKQTNKQTKTHEVNTLWQSLTTIQK